MRYAQQFINYWINSGDICLDNKLGVNDSMFELQIDKKMYNYIKQYADNYNKMPTHEIVFTKFPKYEMADGDLHSEFIINELRGERDVRFIKALFKGTIDLVNEGDPTSAIQHIHTSLDSYDNVTNYSSKPYGWIDQADNRLNVYKEKHGRASGIGTIAGIPELDTVMGGIEPDDYILVSARVNEGKTLMANFILYNAWKWHKYLNINKPLVYFSTEMMADKISNRLDTLRYGLSNRGFNSGSLLEEELELYEEFIRFTRKKDSDIQILDPSTFDREFCVKDYRDIAKSLEPSLIIVDQLYDLAPSVPVRTERERILNVNRDLKRNSDVYKIPTIVLAQANRGAVTRKKNNEEDLPPELHEIQESDNPAQKATKVLTLKMKDGILVTCLRKNREGEKNKLFYTKADIDKGIYVPINKEELTF